MNWKERPEIIGENNISDGVEITGNNVISKYGYYGKAAAWDVGDVHMKGGAGPMNTIYSWGTLKEAGIDGVEAYDIAKASIPMGIIAIILAAIKNYMFDKKIKVKKGDING